MPSLLNPVTVKLAGVASDADPDPDSVFVPGQDRLTVTEPAGLLGTKSFDTVNVAEFNVLDDRARPPRQAELSPVQVPVLEYPVGTADWVVHDVVPSLLNPVDGEARRRRLRRRPRPGIDVRARTGQAHRHRTRWVVGHEVLRHVRHPSSTC